MVEAYAPNNTSRGTTFAERVPPHNLDAEQAVLGSMILSTEATEEAVELLAAEDFYRGAHATMFDVMRSLHAVGEPIDALTVADKLESLGKLDAIGGKPYLIDVTNAVPTSANVAYYAGIVRRTSTLRRLINASTTIAGMCYEAPDEVEPIIEQAEKAVLDVTQQRVSSNFTSMADLLVSNMDELDLLSQNKGHLTGVPTGFRDLDKILNGMHASDLIILAARPAVGKTAFALNMASNAAKAGHPVMVFSLEMSGTQLSQRMLCSESRVDSYRMRSGNLQDADWSALVQGMSALEKRPIYIDDTPSISLVEIRAKARRKMHELAKLGKTGLIIVDYLQLMQPAGHGGRRAENRQVEIAEMSRGLKILAKELKVPVVALSQLSRAVEQRADKRPILSDLRESGAIEQDADVVMFIDRNTDTNAAEADPEVQSKRPPRGEAEVIVAKHRNGPVDSCRLSFIDTFTKFSDLAHSY